MSVFAPSLGFAAAPPLELSYQGRILHADGTPVSGPVDFQIQIRSPLDSNCLMFEEERTVTIPADARGAFSFNINGPGGTRTDPELYKFEEIFSNRKPFAYTNTDCAVSSPFNPEATSARTVIVSFNQNGTWETLPTMTTAYTPQAIESLSVGGYGSGDLLRVDRTSSSQVVNAFTHADYLTLVDLVAGKIGGKTLPVLTNGQVLGVDGAGDWQGITPLTAASVPDCLTGEYLRGSSGTLVCAAVSGGSGSVTSVGITVPSYMSAGAAITSSGTIALDFVAQAANTVFAGPTLGSAAPGFRTLNISDIKSSMTGDFFAASGACTAGQTLTYSSVSDSISCAAYSITNAQAVDALGYTPVNIAGDVMTGALTLPANGLTVGTSQLVASGGNIGIGTTSPAAKLDVVGAGDASAIIVPRDGTRPTTAVNGMIRYNTGTNALEAFANGSWSNLAGAGSGGSFLPLAGGTMSGAIDMGGQRINGGSAANASLTLDSTSNTTKGNIVMNPSGGSVVVGTTTPDAKLDVEDSVRVFSNATWPTMKLESGNTDTHTPTFVFKGGRTNGTAFPQDGAWLGEFIFRNTDNDDSAKIYVVSTENQNGNAAGAGIGFQTTPNGTTTPLDRLFIDHSGYVGIGTTDPTSKFSVAGAATDNARFFYDNANVGASDDGQSLYIYRREAGGDSHIRLYNDAYRQAHFAVSGNGNLLFDATGIYMTLPSPYSYVPDSTSQYIPNMAGPMVGTNAYGSTKAGGIILQTGNTTHRQYGYLAALANDGSRAPNIVIGAQTGATSYEERMRIDPVGNVAIGTTEPGGSKLHVEGQITTVGNAFIGAGEADFIQLSANGGSPGSIELRNGGTAIMTLPTGGSTGTGNVGIGRAAPSYKLDVNGTIRGVGITDSSDIRLKRDINPLEMSLEKVLQLKGVTYFWKEEDKGQRLQIGLIAQDVEKTYPELVDTDKEGMKSVNYSHLVSPLIEAVKELYQRIVHHNLRIERLEDENARLISIEKKQAVEIESLKQQMAADKAEADARLKRLEQLIGVK